MYDLFVWLLVVTLPILSVFLILLILVQRGRGGGLVGAFGGMGGQSAFGAKAGDVFTKATVVVVCLWIFICIALLLLMKPGTNAPSRSFGEGRSSATESTPAGSGAPVTTPNPPVGPPDN